MVSDVPLMYGMVAVVVSVELAFVSVVSVGRAVSVSSNKVVFVAVFCQKHVKGICFRRINCLVCCKLVALVSLES